MACQLIAQVGNLLRTHQLTADAHVMDRSIQTAKPSQGSLNGMS
jgi:hypothetical protein